jgi:hypothetical protein
LAYSALLLEPCHQSFCLCFILRQTANFAQAGLELFILLPLPPTDGRGDPILLRSQFFFFWLGCKNFFLVKFENLKYIYILDISPLLNIWCIKIFSHLVVYPFFIVLESLQEQLLILIKNLFLFFCSLCFGVVSCLTPNCKAFMSPRSSKVPYLRL